MALSARVALILLLLSLPALSTASGAAAEEIQGGIRLEPDSTSIGMNYTGTTIRVSAEVPAGSEAAIRVLGRAETLEMKRKGKVAHLLWMNLGDVTFQAVPTVYFLLTSVPLAHAAPASALREWKLGYDALASAVGWDPGLSRELVKLKEREGCFLAGEGHLVRSGATPGAAMQGWTGEFRFPAQAPAGEYTVDLFGVHDQQVVHLASTTLRLERTGVARLLRSVAMEHGLIYGGVAIVVALLAGLFTGFVFHPKWGRRK
jgi:Putative transmembrane protein (Alph_Pro_TM)